jgi:hypothetical protein
MTGHEKNLIRNSTAEFLIITSTAGEESIEVRYEDETIWLSQKMMAALFDVKIPTINEHLKNIYESGELTRKATIRNFLIVRTEGNRDVSRNLEYYSLDAIISVGYRINSKRATQFRQWATRVLRVGGAGRQDGKIPNNMTRQVPGKSNRHKYRSGTNLLLRESS